MAALISVRHTVITNTAAQLIGRLIGAVTTFLITLLIARQFGSAGYGDFVKITTFIAFFYLLADFGINAIFLQNEEIQWEDLLALRLIISVFLVGAAMVALQFLPRGSAQGYTTFVRLGILLFAPSIIFQALITTANAVFQKFLKYNSAAVAVGLGSIATLLVAWLAAGKTAAQEGVWICILSLLIGSAITAWVGLWYANRLYKHIHKSVQMAHLWPLFWASIPLGFTLLFNLVYFRIDSIILTLTRTTQEVGVYGLAYKVFELPLVLPTFFMNSLYPLLLKKNADNVTALIKQSAVYLFFGGMVVLVGFWILAPLLVYIRPEFAPGINALRVLSLGFPVFFLSSLTMWALIAKRKQRLLVGIYGISMILNIVLNTIFVPSRGFMAAAWITVASEAVVLCLSGGALLPLLKRSNTV